MSEEQKDNVTNAFDEAEVVQGTVGGAGVVPDMNLDDLSSTPEELSSSELAAEADDMDDQEIGGLPDPKVQIPEAPAEVHPAMLGDTTPNIPLIGQEQEAVPEASTEMHECGLWECMVDRQDKLKAKAYAAEYFKIHRVNTNQIHKMLNEATPDEKKAYAVYARVMGILKLTLAHFIVARRMIQRGLPMAKPGQLDPTKLAATPYQQM